MTPRYSDETIEQLLDASTIAAMIILDADNATMQLWPVKPDRLSLSDRQEICGRYSAQQLRVAGVVGLGDGSTPQLLLKAPLPAETVADIQDAFRLYVIEIFCPGTAQRQADAEVAELERRFAL